MVLLFRCLTHDNKWLSGNECLIAFVRARSSSDPNIGDDGASMSSRLSVSKNLEKVEKSELPCMRIGPKNRGCVFVDCLSRAMFLKVVTVTCLHHMVILRSQNKFRDFLRILDKI